jgi:isopentenyl phosphate kinase
MITFLKLGGSLLTDKTQDKTIRPDIVSRISREIAEYIEHPHCRPLLLGHGSGSFGHTTAKKYGTRAGVRNPNEWRGFAEVSVAAQQLNRIIADALAHAGVPVFSVMPSSSVRCVDGRIVHMDVTPIRTALSHGLVPLVMGDVAFDEVRGGTIVSTEEVFAYLVTCMPVEHVLLAGETAGVYASMSDRRVLPRITPASWAEQRVGVGASRGADVTGGMASKVQDMLALVTTHPGLDVRIFSGLEPGAVRRALEGENSGTLVVGEESR